MRKDYVNLSNYPRTKLQIFVKSFYNSTDPISSSPLTANIEKGKVVHDSNHDIKKAKGASSGVDDNSERLPKSY